MSQVIPDRYRTRFKKNLEFLQTHYPALYRKIQRRHLESSIERTRSGHLTLKLRGSYIESRYDPERELRRRQQEANDTTQRTVFYLGSGLGYHINREQSPKGSGAILIERDLDIFRAALYIIEPSILQSLVLLVDADRQALEHEVACAKVTKARIVEHTRSVQVHREYYDDVKRFMADTLKTGLASDTTVQASMRLWIRNVFRNLVFCRGESYGTRELLRAFSGPVILVASGPFLEGIASDLSRWSRNIPVLSLLPSVPFLQHYGVSTDFIVTTDAGFWNRYRFVHGLTVPLITTYSADPVLLANYEGPRFLFSHDLNVEKLLPSIIRASLVVPMQGTSSIVMIHLARMMGFTELYLAGYDFAYQGAKDHHEGAGFDRLLLSTVNRLEPLATVMAGRMRSDGIVEAEDYFGKAIHSSHKLLLYRAWLEREMIHQGLKRLNNGARVEGVPIARPEELDAWGPGTRKAFEDAVHGLGMSPLNPHAPAEGFRKMWELIGGADEVSLQMVREHIFGPAPRPLDKNTIRSDIEYVRRELEIMGRRLKNS